MGLTKGEKTGQTRRNGWEKKNRGEKGVQVLAIIRPAAPMHRVSPPGTKRTKWPSFHSSSNSFNPYA